MGKFKYSMQNILDIKIKLETQAKNEFSEANRAYLTEKEKLEELFKKRAVYEAALKEQLSGSLNISEINICKKNINSLKSAIRTQLMNVKKAEDMLEVKRVALNELMKERKTHEKLRDKKFEETEQDSQMQDSQTAQEDTQQEATQPAADAKQETVEPQDAVTTYTISVTSQDTCRTIAEKLKALNLVDDAEQFRIYMGQKGADHFIADGEHVIPQGASYDDIITILTQK